MNAKIRAAINHKVFAAVPCVLKLKKVLIMALDNLIRIWYAIFSFVVLFVFIILVIFKNKTIFGIRGIVLIKILLWLYIIVTAVHVFSLYS